MQAVAVLLGVAIVILAGILWELRGIRVGIKAETPAQKVLTAAVAVAALCVAVWTVFTILRS
jgi:hypothetical protein